MPLALTEIPITEGLTYISGYALEREVQELLSKIHEQPWSSELKRRVQHYGFRYDYRARRISRTDHLGPIPDWLLPICKKLVAEKIFPKQPDQVIINEYLPDQGIAPHIDCVPCFGETIASLSLGSSCEMVFSRGDDQVQRLILEAGSLLVLTGAARFDYKHAIPARKTDVINGIRVPRQRRISLTFRTVNLT
jgi:alkylated DNA repair dioxygenase AlkB